MKAKIQVTTLSIILWIIFLLAIKLIYSNWFLNHAIAGIVVLFVLFGTMFYVNGIRDIKIKYDEKRNKRLTANR